MFPLEKLLLFVFEGLRDSFYSFGSVLKSRSFMFIVSERRGFLRRNQTCGTYCPAVCFPQSPPPEFFGASVHELEENTYEKTLFGAVEKVICRIKNRVERCCRSVAVGTRHSVSVQNETIDFGRAQHAVPLR